VHVLARAMAVVMRGIVHALVAVCLVFNRPQASPPQYRLP